MQTLPANPHSPQGIHRRDVLKAGLAASVTLSAWPLAGPAALWGAEAGQPRRGGLLRVWGYDPPHFDPQLTINAKTHTTLSFVHSTLLGINSAQGFNRAASSSSRIWPNAGSSQTIQPMSSTCVLEADLLLLDGGEQEAILLAQELHADLVLLDDREARKAAIRRALRVMGTVGVWNKWGIGNRG